MASILTGGDWAIAPQGAVSLEGTVNTTIASCNFTRLDGTAVFASNFHRDLAIVNNSFELIGMHHIYPAYENINVFVLFDEVEVLMLQCCSL
eukprot:SAG31_NODE_4182_length_3495_cov_1.750294_3_plen_92_part_00